MIATGNWHSSSLWRWTTVRTSHDTLHQIWVQFADDAPVEIVDATLSSLDPADPLCVCEDGFVGARCAFTDAATCSGHGAATAAGTCACEAGYFGGITSQFDTACAEAGAWVWAVRPVLQRVCSGLI